MSKIPAGYKQTEVGVIPEDWEPQSFSKVAEIGDGLHGTPNYSESGAFFFINGNNLVSGEIKIFADTKKVAESELRKAPVQLGTNSVLLSINGTIGNCALYKNEPVMLGKSAAYLSVRANCERQYVYYVVQSKQVLDHFYDSLTGSTIKNLGLTTIRSTIFPLPPLPEQKRIAQVLGDVDALIQKLEALIAKKRDIKQATMQELLTGKRRLPGFNGPWETKKLPEVCWFQEGPGVRTHQFTSSGVKLLNGTNISDGKLVLESTNRFIAESEANGWYSHFLVDTGDILIACSGITIEKFDEKVTEAEEVHLPLCMNTSTMRFKVTSPNLIKSYLKHFLKSDSFKDQISGKATGSAQLNFGPSHVMKVQISLPSSSEQTAIAQVLSDMDNALAQLETRLGKTRDLKAGLMQQLLTGKIRLRVESYA